MSKTIGIFCHGQAGDAATVSSVLKYKNELWGEDAKIVWYISNENADLLKHQDIEVREFPRGYGYPEMVERENQKLIDEGKEPIWADFLPYVDENNHLNLELKNNHPLLKEFDYGYFPAPHQVPIDKRRGINYPIVSKNVFGIPNEYEWHPVLEFSQEEIVKVYDYMDKMSLLLFYPAGKKIAIETFAGSGQSKLTALQIIDAMDLCRKILGDCNFIFLSHKFINGNENYPEGLINNIGVATASRFTVRECALIVGNCDLLLSVSSGITVASSCWGNPKVPILQYAGSEICATKELALGEFVLVTTDGKSERTAQEEYFTELTKLLNKIK